MKKNSTFYSGFTATDELIFRLIGNILQTKLQYSHALIEKRAIQKEVVETIKMSSLISTQRSYSDLIIASQEVLPSFFQFEGLGILFRDKKTNYLFTIEQTFDEIEIKKM